MVGARLLQETYGARGQSQTKIEASKLSETQRQWHTCREIAMKRQFPYTENYEETKNE